MTPVTLTNWAGNVRFGAKQLHRPASIAELCDIVGAAERIRALGTRHSFSDIADSPGDLVTVAGLPAEIEIDSGAATVRVSAGLRYGEVAGHLHAAGWALPNLGSLPHISIAGACATGTHGSGNRNGNLSSAVAALDLVTAGGEIVHISGADRCGAVVGLGGLGVVTHMILRMVPTFTVAQFVYDDLPLEEPEGVLDEAFAAGYSVSLFTDWKGDRANQVWVKSRVGEDSPPPARWLGARLADSPRHPIAGMPAQNCTEQLGKPGPWHERLPHFRLEFTPSAGEELQSEYLVPRERAVEALAAIRGIRERVASVLQISELRTVAGDDLWLSPSYGRDSLAIHFTWVKDPAAVAPVIDAVEERLAPLEPRPHWGKLFSTPAPVLRQRYERFEDFKQLVQRFDPAGKFRNRWLDRLLAGTEVTSGG